MVLNQKNCKIIVEQTEYKVKLNNTAIGTNCVCLSLWICVQKRAVLSLTELWRLSEQKVLEHGITLYPNLQGVLFTKRLRI